MLEPTLEILLALDGLTREEMIEVLQEAKDINEVYAIIGRR